VVGYGRRPVDPAVARVDDVHGRGLLRRERDAGVRRHGGGGADAGNDLERDAGLVQGQRLLGEPAEQAGVAVEEPDDESVAAQRLGGADEQLGARGAGQLLAVLAVAGVDERDVGAGEPGDQLVAVQLVDEDGVGGREPVAGSQRDESGIAGPAPTKATRPTGLPARVVAVGVTRPAPCGVGG
jgi:hypothetical protein